MQRSWAAQIGKDFEGILDQDVHDWERLQSTLIYFRIVLQLVGWSPGKNVTMARIMDSFDGKKDRRDQVAMAPERGIQLF
jgi:hypothetical protein